MLNLEQIDLSQFKSYNNKAFIGIGIDLDQKIYKYTTLENLLTMLDTRAFFVSNRLGFSDRRERGEFYNKKFYFFHFYQNGKKVPESVRELWDYQDAQLREVYKLYASCWTLKSEEDFLMWKAYAGNSIGVRIGTTIKNALISFSIGDEYVIYGNRMKYEGERRTYDITEAMFFKTKYYEYENELRFYFIDTKGNSECENIYLNINQQEFITEIIISPFIGEKVQKMTNEMLTNKYEFLSNKIKISHILES